MSEHYFSENPSSEIKEKQFTEAIRGVTLKFTAVSGVFSFEEKIDKASKLLIENFTPSSKTILDMGCGFGSIGLFIKALFPTQNICLCDVNNRALEYAGLNSRNNKLPVEILKSNLFSDLKDMLFDDIVSNPPIAAGKKLNTELIFKSYVHLNKGGALWLVAFHNKGGSTLKGIMSECFGNVEDIEKSGGMRVYKSVKNG